MKNEHKTFTFAINVQLSSKDFWILAHFLLNIVLIWQVTSC